MYLRDSKRKYLKPDQRARIWSHEMKEAALAVVGHGMGPSLKDLPRRAPVDDEIRSWLSESVMRDAYEILWDQVKNLSEEERPKAAPQADCFALFALAKAVGATRALEIGTHLGYSTLHLASALSENGVHSKLTTVDIIDVNCENAAHYRSFGASMSAKKRLRALGLENQVEFVVGPSDAFLKRRHDTYDMIFIDGDHSEVGAYFDLTNSLQRLNENGIIVLHDYYDPNISTQEEASGQFGVYWALHRLRAHIPDLDVLPLHNIMLAGATSPVPTSLAVVTKHNSIP